VFLSMGKERYVPVVVDADEEKIGIRKIITIGGAVDERITDGLYNSNSIREFVKMLLNPAVLETPLEKREEDQK
jgi:pyruvate/2-oxoglutarate dehydrogenase complex dihydrolipoamide acyltransferase (E2) component